MDWSAIGIDALAGGVAGLVGLVLSKAIKAPAQRQPIIIVAVVAASVGASAALHHRKTPREQLVDAMLRQRAAVTATSEPMARALAYMSGDMAASPVAVDCMLAQATNDPEHIRTAAANKVADGLRRSDDDSLGERATVVSALLETAPLTACAGLGRGDGSPATLTLLFSHATDAQLHSWAHFSVRAMQASIRNSPPRALADADLDAAMEELQTRLGLVAEHRVGRERYYCIQPAPLTEVARWITHFEHFWNERLDALGRHLERKP